MGSVKITRTFVHFIANLFCCPRSVFSSIPNFLVRVCLPLFPRLSGVSRAKEKRQKRGLWCGEMRAQKENDSAGRRRLVEKKCMPAYQLERGRSSWWRGEDQGM